MPFVLETCEETGLPLRHLNVPQVAYQCIHRDLRLD
jgi:hypothetical protein